MTEERSLQESLRDMAKNWPEGDKNLVDVKCTGIERAIPPEGHSAYHDRLKQLENEENAPYAPAYEDAIKALEYCALARTFGVSEKGALFLMKAESARKDFELFDDAIKAGKVAAKNKELLNKMHKAKK